MYHHYAHHNCCTKSIWAPQFCSLIEVPLPYVKHWQAWQEILSQHLEQSRSSASCSTLHHHCSVPPGSVCASHVEIHTLLYQGRSGTIKQQSLIAIIPLKASTLLRVPSSSTEETLSSISILRRERVTRLLVVKPELDPSTSENRQSVQKIFNPELAQLPLDHIQQVQQFL